ncbi:MAG: amidinotransferase [Flavisolibacter sp.]|nr:amidinotransferase [Flavisolibacter sp.]
MVRPAAFSYNEETAANNLFQQASSLSKETLQQKALAQFDAMVKMLLVKGIHVIVQDDDVDPPKPDAVFPNNWFLTGADGGIHLFPMFAPNRRKERSSAIVDALKESFVFDYIKDWSDGEALNEFLEGTGSMVFDHNNRIIYACISERTNVNALKRFAEDMQYRAIPFTAEFEGAPVYHTNVMLSIGEGFAVLCPKSIADHTERIAVAQLLEATGHENIYVEPEHMKNFACNLLQVKNNAGKRMIVISQSAVNALPQEKLERLQHHGELLPIDVSLIESVNGGSVRCMVAEIFLKRRQAVT